MVNSNQTVQGGIVMTKRKAYLYMRGNSSGNINTQKKVAEDYCVKNNLLISELFTDIGYSGLCYDREGLNHMLSLINNGTTNVDALLLPSYNRLGRDTFGNLELLLNITKSVKEVILVDVEKEINHKSLLQPAFHLISLESAPIKN